MATEVMDLMLGRLRGGPFRFQSEQRRCKHADKIERDVAIYAQRRKVMAVEPKEMIGRRLSQEEAKRLLAKLE